jgi:hypothetical protein
MSVPEAFSPRTTGGIVSGQSTSKTLAVQVNSWSWVFSAAGRSMMVPRASRG